MKKLVFAFAAALALAATADEQHKTLPVPASKMAEFNAKTGGLVNPPANAKALVFLDARPDRTPSLENQVKSAEMSLGFAIDLKPVTLDAKACPRNFAFDARKNGAGAVVLVYERAGDPVLSTFPEDAVSLVNVAPLKADNPGSKWLTRRIMTEFWRSIAFAMGGYATPGKMGGASLQPIFSLKDYESLNGAGLSPMQIASLAEAKTKLGICSRNPVPYSRACREGWAPAPTNDVQKSIYKRFTDPSARFNEEYKPKADATPAKK